MKRYDMVTKYRCGSSVDELEPSDDGEWVRFEDVDAGRADMDVQHAEVIDQQAERLAALEAENAAIRELMNVYNLGGWTDAVGPMKRALKAEAEVGRITGERDTAIVEKHDHVKAFDRDHAIEHWRQRAEQAEFRADQLAAETNQWRCADRDKAATIAALTIARDEANAERLDALRSRDIAQAAVERLTGERDEAQREFREFADERRVTVDRLIAEVAQAQAALRMVADTMADIDRCEASVLCSECQAIKDAMLSGVQAALAATREGA